MKFTAKKQSRIPFTKAGFEKIVQERDFLLTQRPEAVEHLRKSREMGDLSENGYYKASRAKLSFIDARLRSFEGIIKRAKIVVSTHTGLIDIGDKVILKTDNKTVEYTIVGGYESDPTKNLISHVSPLGKALMGKRVGDTVSVAAPAGTKAYVILKIS
ncbi:transcription elongation factor GreA [Candidatus Gottesmanbacteria bacterium]|nr:transcription elongation factor GreA [Candidatus Gottesmanbacteria bacterium]